MSLTQLRNLGIVANAGISTTKLGAGAIIQVSNLVVSNSNQVLATTAYTDLTNMSLSITPSSTSNKILLVSNVQAKLEANESFGLAYVRNSTIIAYSGDANELYSNFVNGVTAVYQTFPFVYMDSPSSTSSITYKIQAGSYVSNSIQFSDGANLTFYAMEIAG